MSHGPGNVERPIAELFRATADTRPLTVADLCQHVFGAAQPTRAQRSSALRAAHRILARSQAALRKCRGAAEKADAAIEKRFGRNWQKVRAAQNEYFKLRTEFEGARPPDTSLSSWRATERRGGLLVFHDRRYPVRVWAVVISLAGVVWREAEMVRVTEERVTVRYQDEPAVLNRWRLSVHGAWYRGVLFVSERDGRTADRLYQAWFEQFGHSLPQDELPLDLEKARLLLGVPVNYTIDDVIAAFRRKAKCCHPDLGGTAEQFRDLVAARDRLLAAVGEHAPPLKEPKFAPKGAKIVYRAVRLPRGQTRLGAVASG